MTRTTRGSMRQYRVHLYTAPAIVDGHPHWAVSCHGDDLLEVGDYHEAIELASNLAGADAILSGVDVEVIVDANHAIAARRIIFHGNEMPDESAESDPRVA